MADTNDSLAARTAHGAGWLVGWQIATRSLGLVSTLLLTHLLVPADFGIVAMALTFTAAINALSSLGVADALVRRPDTAEHWYDTAFTLQALRGVLTAGAIALGSGPTSTWFDEPRLVPVLGILAASSLLAGFENIGIVEFRRTMRFDIEFRLLLMPRLLQFCVAVALAYVWRDYRSLVIATTAGAALRLLLTYTIHHYRPRLSLEHWRELMGFSVWIWAGSLASFAWERCDAFVLGPALGPARLGVYLFSAEIATMPVTEVVGPAMRALYSGLSLARHRGSEVASVALSVAAALLTIVVPIAIGLSATSGYIVTGLLGPKWEAARAMITVFAWLCCVSPISWVCSSVLTAQGQVRLNFLAIAGAAAAKCLALSFVLAAGRLDLAPLVAVGSVALESALFLILLGRVEDPHWHDNAGGFLRIALGGATGVAMLLATGLGWRAVSAPPLLALAQGVALGLMTMAVCIGTQFASWWIAGRPAGPERRLLDTALAAVRRSRAQPAKAV